MKEREKEGDESTTEKTREKTGDGSCFLFSSRRKNKGRRRWVNTD